MRMQPAIALDDYRDDVAGFGDRESRRARREARRNRRQQRKEGRREERQEKRSDRQERRADRRDDRRGRRQERRLDRVQRKKSKVREKLSRVPGPAPRRPLVRRPAPSLQPATTPRSQARPPSQDPSWPEEAWDAAEEFFDDELEPEDGYEDAPEEEGYEDEGDEGYEQDATEGIGAWRPFRRKPATARRPAPTAGPVEAGPWGPAVRMGRRLRIQAAAGHRAAVIDLKPGLFLVAELPDAVTRTEFGLVPMIAPLMINAARRAMDEPPRERRGPLAALFRRRRDEPVRYIEVQQATAPLALPGPVATEPAPVVVPAPNVGWADDATVAATYGCDRLERWRR